MDMSISRKRDGSVDFSFYTEQDRCALLEMYLSFEPKAACQGLPPIKEATTRRWLSGLVENPSNTNFILKRDQEVIAHAALIHYPNYPQEEEIIIFVHQCLRHEGWGRKLLLAAMNWACLYLELRRVWLSVACYNPALRLYSSVGFVAVPSEREGTEIEMQRRLHCKTCLEHKCPVFTAELMRSGVYV